MPSPQLGIGDIGVYEPHEQELLLPNPWFEQRGITSRKFVNHTGIKQRGISFLPEEEMALHAIHNLQERTGVDVRDCAGLVLVSPSLVPEEESGWDQDPLRLFGGNWQDMHKIIGPITGFPEEKLKQWEFKEEYRDWNALAQAALQIGMTRDQVALVAGTCLDAFGSLDETAQTIGERIGVSGTDIRNVNWGCSGYVKGWEVLLGELSDRLAEQREKFLLLLTTSKTSKLLDFGDGETGPLLGDYATATLVTRTDHPSHPARLLPTHISTGLVKTTDLNPTDGHLNPVLFNYQWKQNVLHPTQDGGEERDMARICWTMDGPGVARAAVPAFVNATDEAMQAVGVTLNDVQWMLGHQPGKKMTGWFAGELRDRGYKGNMPLDLNENIGNVVSCSIPHALHTHWNDFEEDQHIMSPATGMYVPGSDRMTLGRLAFRVRGNQHKA